MRRLSSLQSKGCLSPASPAVSMSLPRAWRVAQPTNQPTDRPTNQPFDQPTNQPTNQPTDQQTNHSTNRPTNQHVHDAALELELDVVRPPDERHLPRALCQLSSKVKPHNTTPRFVKPKAPAPRGMTVGCEPFLSTFIKGAGVVQGAGVVYPGVHPIFQGVHPMCQGVHPIPPDARPSP